jgi:hypothetical protein
MRDPAPASVLIDSMMTLRETCEQQPQSSRVRVCMVGGGGGQVCVLKDMV